MNYRDYLSGFQGSFCSVNWASNSVIRIGILPEEFRNDQARANDFCNERSSFSNPCHVGVVEEVGADFICISYPGSSNVLSIPLMRVITFEYAVEDMPK